MKRFQVWFDDEEFLNLTVDEVWPDGNQPDEPMNVDVARVMEICGPQGHVLREWNLLTFPHMGSVDPDTCTVRVGDVAVWQNDPAVREAHEREGSA